MKRVFFLMQSLFLTFSVCSQTPLANSLANKMIYRRFLSCLIYDLEDFFLPLMNLASDLHSNHELACLMDTMKNWFLWGICVRVCVKRWRLGYLSELKTFFVSLSELPEVS